MDACWVRVVATIIAHRRNAPTCPAQLTACAGPSGPANGSVGVFFRMPRLRVGRKISIGESELGAGKWTSIAAPASAWVFVAGSVLQGEESRATGYR
jgi:hypothetical protein